MRRLLRGLFQGILIILGASALAAAASVLYAVLILAPDLPDADALRDVELQEPLRVLSVEGELMAEYGEQRRKPVDIEEMPTSLLLAFIAAEDDRFYEHAGVDYQGLARAVLYVAREQEVGPGGSTITMQVARNFFLSRDQTILRKVNEILLALEIERTLSKEEILELYLNKIYLGNGAYGVGAAAQVYYGSDLEGLSLAQCAVLAGLPKAPSHLNPIQDPERALKRRSYVLERMLSEGYITSRRYRKAVEAPLTAEVHTPQKAVSAGYAAEMVRRTMVERYGREEAYTSGYTVYTTIQGERQEAANEALRAGLREYSRRHGYRGPEGAVEAQVVGDAEAMDEALADHPTLGGLQAAIVLSVEPEAAWVWLDGGEVLRVDMDTMAWARRQLGVNHRGPQPEVASDVLAVGDIVRVERRGDGAGALAALPEVEGALVALDPEDGRVRALSGGFDFQRSSFNRAVQARRQVGSAFKPFIYSAALEHGYTLATQVNDAPVVFEGEGLGGHWRPGNYTGRFHGPTRLREALVFSRNLVSIRVLRDIGVEPTIRHAEAFGFEREHMPADLSLALGSNSSTPMQMATGFAAFANGGYRVVPNLIEQVVDAQGNVVLDPAFPAACELCQDDLPVDSTLVEPYGVLDLPLEPERAIPADNAWLMNSVLADVVQRGTGRGARKYLERGDLAGKTGTTSGLRDAWFVGYSPELVAASWVGFDAQRSLGAGETGAAAALPIWARFMAAGLEGVEEREVPRPDGLVTLRIDPQTGRATSSGDPDGIFETFRVERAPPRHGSEEGGSDRQTGVREIF